MRDRFYIGAFFYKIQRIGKDLYFISRIIPQTYRYEISISDIPITGGAWMTPRVFPKGDYVTRKGKVFFYAV